MSAPTSDRRLGGLSFEIEHRVTTLDNGLEVIVAPDHHAPVVATALFYPFGTRHEPDHAHGGAHFLEHMMFKGSTRWPPGEIDRQTEARGGDNNAYTTHDGTVYWFQFGSEQWETALAIEADRMRALTLDPGEVERERRVIVEEIGMYEDDPWDALDAGSAARLFSGSAYGRPILGTRESLAAIDGSVLSDLYRAWYQPAGSILVIAGDVPDDVVDRVRARFAQVEGRVPPRPRPAGVGPVQASRIELRRGHVARLQVSWRLPAALPERQKFLVQLGVGAIAEGRLSRLQRLFVEDAPLATWLSGETRIQEGDGAVVVALELVPGVEPEEVEKRLFDALSSLEQRPLVAAELERARRQAIVDRAYGLERAYQRAVALGTAALSFDLGWLERLHRTTLEAKAEEVSAALTGVFQSENGPIVAWAHAAEGDQ